MLACPAQRPELSLNTTNAEASRDDNRVDASELASSTFGCLARIRRDPANINSGIVRETAVLDCLRHR